MRLENDWKIFGRILENSWKMFKKLLKTLLINDQKMFGKRLKNYYIVDWKMIQILLGIENVWTFFIGLVTSFNLLFISLG